MDFADLMAVVDSAVVSSGPLTGRVTYTPTVGAAVVVRGVFDAVYNRVDAGEAGVSSSGPAVSLVLADLPSDPEEDATATVTVSGVMYTAHEVKKDGMGVVTMLLHKV
jgi:hypothetical protein